MVSGLATPLVKTDRLSDPYVTAGDRLYVIGTQDGRFPDLGWHVPGEMGGVWAHPIKLLDGYWLAVDGTWLPPARRFTSGPFWSEHEYLLADGLHLACRQFVPDGLAALHVRYSLVADTARTLTLRFLARTELRPVWRAEQAGIEDGTDAATYLPELSAWLARDEGNPRYVLVGAVGREPMAHDVRSQEWGPEQTAGQGVSVLLEYQISLRPGEAAELSLIVAGSDESEAAACEAFRRARSGAEESWAAKERRYATMLGRSRLAVPDPDIMRAWDWLKCNNDWLVRDVPGVGRGIGAGVAHYPWWFGCDSSYAVPACLVLGQHEIALDTLDLVRRYSEEANGRSGRVLHECTTRGQVVHPGCAEETPQFTTAIWQAFCWTGDLNFLQRSYDFCRRGLLDWTLGACCQEDDPLPYGYGIIEAVGVDVQCLDTTVHTLRGLLSLAGMAEVLEDGAVRRDCLDRLATLWPRFDQAFWMEEEGLYGDMVASPAEMMPRLEEWLARATREGAPPAAVSELQRQLQAAREDPEPDRKQPWLGKNWTVVGPFEAGLALPRTAPHALRRMESPEFSGTWGMYQNGLFQWTPMSINTGALAVAQMEYGRVAEAVQSMRTIARTLTLHMPGAISELSPDGGCFVQAWSAYGIAWPVVSQIFGLQPEAHRRRLVVSPAFPAGWGGATLEAVRIGDASFDFRWDGTRLHVQCDRPDWEVVTAAWPAGEDLPPALAGSRDLVTTGGLRGERAVGERTA